jgi:phosphoribosylaminoimidazole-succinocarboxamide synthase
VAQQLPHTLGGTSFPALGVKYQGKVRDTYRKGDTLALVTTDRLSAFDHVLTTIPFKGETLNRLSNFWFEKTKHVVNNHVLDMPDPNVTIARACTPLPIEVVIRGYLTGSLWRDYEKGAHLAYGLPLAPGLKKDQRFDGPLVTPSTKAEYGQHDEPISEQELLARGLVAERDWRRAVEAALTLFTEGQRWAKGRGLILVDTKYEFGLQGDALYVIDEIHTPDSSRYWVAGEYDERFARGDDQRMLDKENIRQWLIRERGFQGQGTPPPIPDEVRCELAEKYLAAYQLLTGQPLKLAVGDVNERLLKNLKAKGYL